MRRITTRRLSGQPSSVSLSAIGAANNLSKRAIYLKVLAVLAL